MPFQRGQSGNPGGRPRGIQTQAKLRKAIEAHVPSIIDALVQAARNGDTTAARLLLDRTLPALRPVDKPTALPLGEDLTQAAAAVLANLGAGRLGTDQARDLAGVLAALARVRESEELEARIAALEEREHVHASPR